MTDFLLVAELPNGLFGESFGRGVHGPDVAGLARAGLGPFVPVRFRELVRRVGGVEHGGHGRGHDERFELGAGVLVGGVEDAETSLDRGDHDLVPCRQFVADWRGGVDHCRDAWVEAGARPSFSEGAFMEGLG